jgi:hypothetical protein
MATTSALVATAGSATANAYVTVAVANQYDADRISVGTTWEDSPLRAASILWATKLLDRLIQWTGYPTDPDTQALLWPRTGMWDRRGNYIDSDVIPTDLQHATAEFARQLLVTDLAGDSDMAGLESLKVGTLALKFSGAANITTVPETVLYLLPEDWYWNVGGRSAGVRVRELARG